MMSQTQVKSRSENIQLKVSAAAQLAYLLLNASGRSLPDVEDDVIPTFAECKAHINGVLQRAIAGYYDAAKFPRPSIAHEMDDVQGMYADSLFDCVVSGDGSDNFSVEFWLRLS
jgi:hypothetical protein